MQTLITKGSNGKTKPRKVKSRRWPRTHCCLTFRTLLLKRFSDSFPQNLPYAQALFPNNGQACGLWESPSYISMTRENPMTAGSCCSWTSLKHFERTKLLELDRFMLRMRYDSQVIDSTRLDKWFSFVVDRRAKELFISIRSSVVKETTYNCIPHTILNAQYLTHLNLQHVRIPESTDLISLPLLKIMTLYAVLFDCNMDFDRSLWKGCPSIYQAFVASFVFF